MSSDEQHRTLRKRPRVSYGPKGDGNRADAGSANEDGLGRMSNSIDCDDEEDVQGLIIGRLDSEDDSTATPQVMEEAEISTIADADHNTIAKEERSLSTGRLVMLSIKVSSDSYTKFLLCEDIVRTIPRYANLLDKAQGGRKRLYDRIIRKEEAMAQLFDFIANGTLEPFDTGDPIACTQTLSELIDLYDMALDFKLEEVEHAIVYHIASLAAFDESVFVAFARECYRTGKSGHKISPKCSMGQLIKGQMTQHLKRLIQSGAGNEIKSIGGTLSEQFVEVLMESYMAPTANEGGLEKCEVKNEA